MKVKICCEERFPVFYLEVEGDKFYNPKGEIEVSDQFIERYKMIQDKYSGMQYELEKLFKKE